MPIVLLMIFKNNLLFLDTDFCNYAIKIIDTQPVNKSNLEPYYFLALCYESSGNEKKAKSVYDKILIEDYNFKGVRWRAAKIEKDQP